MDIALRINKMYRLYSLLHPSLTSSNPDIIWQMPLEFAQAILKQYTEPLNTNSPAQIDMNGMTFLGLRVEYIDEYEINLVIKVA